jgi:DNA-binding NtrC family response regulator
MPYKEAKNLVLMNFDRAYVTTLLERQDNNVQRAAEAAGVSRKFIYDLLKRVDEGKSHED